MIMFDVRFEIREIVPMVPNWAFARTNSAGTADFKGQGCGQRSRSEALHLSKGQYSVENRTVLLLDDQPPPK